MLQCPRHLTLVQSILEHRLVKSHDWDPSLVEDEPIRGSRRLTEDNTSAYIQWDSWNMMSESPEFITLKIFLFKNLKTTFNKGFLLRYDVKVCLHFSLKSVLLWLCKLLKEFLNYMNLLFNTAKTTFVKFICRNFKTSINLSEKFVNKTKFLGINWEKL